MDFIPEEQKSVEVPYFDDVTSEGGWQGHSTSKSIRTLKSEVTEAVSRLGGFVTSFQKGTFYIGERKREGFRIRYNIDAGQKLTAGQIDVAALPVRKTTGGRSTSYEKNCEKSLKMALYMLRNAFDGMWFLQQLSPGFAPLMPFMLVEGGKTVSQMWIESPMMNNLLPPGDNSFVDAEILENE